MNRTVVVKFGGSSLADADQFRKVKAIIEADPARRYVIPSAPGKRSDEDNKITDLLYLCQQTASHNMPFNEILGLIEDRYQEIAKDLGLTIDLNEEFYRIKKDLQDGASAAYAASRGEYLNGKMLAEYLGYDFVDAADIIVISRSGGQTHWKETQINIRQKLMNHERAVIPGFYGKTVKGDIITYSRGGSDVTASVIAQGIGASLYENWTDVSGMLMADPRIVPDAKTIHTLTYSELRELTYMGASVLHDEAVFPAMKAKIPINIKNTNRPEDPGTLIVDDSQLDPQTANITGVSGKAGFTIIQIEQMLMNSQRGVFNRLLSIFEFNEISIEHIPSGIDSISVVVNEAEFEPKESRIMREIQAQMNPDRVSIENNLAIIAVVGTGMAKNVGTSKTVFTALAEAGINIRMITQGASEISIFVGVNTEDLHEGIRAIYDAFANKSKQK